MSEKRLKKHKKSRCDNMRRNETKEEEKTNGRTSWKLNSEIFWSPFCRTYRDKITRLTSRAWTFTAKMTSSTSRTPNEGKVRTLKARIYMSAHSCVISMLWVLASLQPRYQKTTCFVLSCYASFFLKSQD